MRRRQLYKFAVCACVLVYIYYVFGVRDYIYARNFDQEFDYPLAGDIRPAVEAVLAGRKPPLAPINYYPHRFLTNSGKCTTLERLDLFIVVKSAMPHLERRDAIRRTYGQENFIPGTLVRTLFFLGVDAPPKSDTQRRIEEEMAQHRDIIQIDFLDDYYNNTIKTMMSFRWLYEHCAVADFYLFTDDDMYISVGNLLEYVHERRGSRSRPRNVTQSAPGGGSEQDGALLAGYVFQSAPQRFRSSKWRVSLEEYPWNRWPPYVTAGAYVVCNRAMRLLYAGSLFVKHFRFDDVYLGIVAKKVGVVPAHCPRFHFYKKTYSREGYRRVIASHGYADPRDLLTVWTEQNSLL
ncbi:PREDICTED: beta-1,3-galactosyltransferase 1 [Papilio xuthus]|uniref:Hexosyltransferase n=1 Tax=Papilio xuthus TaxID=66420 RepID=A0AAJ6ZC73_PAPXU|nr:PREDICTED: beta-1,3-galactosyltransferase 1 [Papilio xuthus]XP_013169461.1 PREDICTED: beta-1,3-galactosyltransferase 1 [Papilio xuthus]